MVRSRPQLVSVKLEKLRPTQLTVGFIEVAKKRKKWKSLPDTARKESLKQHWFPCVIGPEDHYYIVDHHHFGLALLQEEVKSGWGVILKDLSYLPPDKFWTVMEHQQWAHPYDADGVRQSCDTLPSHLKKLQDDPYRSLAGELRTEGGFAKDSTPFSEFLWADFLRGHLTERLLKKDFQQALEQAQVLAHSQAARYLPGWCGKVTEP